MRSQVAGIVVGVVERQLRRLSRVVADPDREHVQPRPGRHRGLGGALHRPPDLGELGDGEGAGGAELRQHEAG